MQAKNGPKLIPSISLIITQWIPS